MRILRPAAALLTAGLLTGGLLAACSGPSQHGAARRGTTAGTAAGQAAAASAAALTAANAPVPLITGGQAQITQAGGQPSVSVKPAIVDGKPASSAATTFNVGGDTYAIPGNAMPYLGTLLDPRLFDVSYLQRAGYSRLPALPVTITWRYASHSAVPGITSAAHGTTTSGTVSSGARLGAALTAGIKAARGAPNVQGPLAQVKRISLAPLPATAAGSATARSAPSSPEAAPAVPLSSTESHPGKVYGLTVTVLGRDGQPSTDAVVAIQNLDSFNAYHSVTAVSTGQVSVSVPAGPYAIEAYAQTDGSFGAFFPEAVSLVTAQAMVGSNSQVTLDARTAKPVTAQVPDAGAAALMATMQFVRRSADGNGLSVADQMYGSGLSTLLTPVQFYATPAPRPQLGSLGFADSWTFVPVGTGLASPDIPYSYLLNFASADGIPTAQSHVVTAADLATVHESFPSTVDGNGDTFLVAPYNPWGLGTFWLFPDWIPFPAPTQRDDYYYGTPGTVWRQLAEGNAPPLDAPTPETAPFGPYVTYHPGEVTSDTWNGGPGVPQPQWQDMGVNDPTIGPLSGFHTDLSYPCPVCRQGQLMSFEAQESDGVPGHWDPVFGYGTGVVSSTTPGQGADDLKFYANGVLTQESGFSSQIFPLLPGTAKYAIDWTSTRPDSVWSTLGTSVTSDWTFTSGPARSSKLPSHEYCSPSPMLSCTYLPLVFASYDFHDGLDGQVTAPGTETFTVTGYHEAGDNAPAVTQATVQVSFDDGKTWTKAPATSLGGGRFRISVTQPDSTGFASVRVFLSDGAGDTLSQTIIHAWALAAASGTSSEGR
jgi:hypothetical protein